MYLAVSCDVANSGTRVGAEVVQVYVTQNNRRALFVSMEFGGKPVLMASLHNDSFDMRNNEAQARQLLEYVGERPAVLAGDFNNRPENSSIKLIRASGKFAGAFDG